MERVTRKECDTWKIITTAHEAGFILTLVVEILLKIFGAFFALFVFFQVEFLDLCQFPSYSQTGYRGLEKGFHCEDSLLHVLTPAPLPVLFPLPSSPPALLSPILEPTMTRVSLYPPSYCHHLSMWLSPESTTLSIEQVSFQNLI